MKESSPPNSWIFWLKKKKKRKNRISIAIFPKKKKKKKKSVALSFFGKSLWDKPFFFFGLTGSIFFFPCVSTHTHLKHKLCWKYTHLLRNVIQKREKIMFSKHLLPTIIIFSPYFCSLIDKLTCTALTFLYGSPLAWFLLSADLIKFPLCKCINCQTSMVNKWID